MKRKCIYNYLSKNPTFKNIIVLGTNNTEKYYLKHIGHTAFETYSFKNGQIEDSRIRDNNLLDIIWANSNIKSVVDEGEYLSITVSYNK